MWANNLKHSINTMLHLAKAWQQPCSMLQNLTHKGVPN